MARRSPGGQHPDDQYPGGQYPAGRGRHAEAPPPPPEMPPPEWADPAVGRRWTQSWRIRATAAQPALPQERLDPPRPPRETGAVPPRDTGAWPAQGAPRRDTGAWQAQRAPQPTEQLPPWEVSAPQGSGWPADPSAATGTLRATAANPALDPARTTGGLRTTGALRTTGSLRATGAQQTTAVARPTSAVRTTGAMRTAKPIAPGTGKARIVLPIVVLSIIVLGLAGVLYLWWRSTLFQHSTGAIMINIGEVLGILAGYGVVVLVALMARLPPLEKAIGTDRLARWHALGGKWVIGTVSGHVVFIVWGYALNARESVTHETVTLLTTFPDVLMAAVAWFILLGVAFFSARAVRRRIAYETWYYAHLYTYLAIALAFSHQFADGGTFAESLTARVAWSSLYAVIGALLLWYRVLIPIRSAARHQFTVQSVRPEAPGIVSVFISGRDFDHLRAEPGQFFRWRFLTRELWWQSHPYSLSAMPQPDLMRITVKSRGDHSGSLANLPPGTRIIAEGPYGAFTPSLTGRRVLFIAGGVGITPIRAMFAALPKRMSGGITLLYRASHPRDVVFSRELNAIASDRQAALHYLIGSREELGYDPLDADHLQQTVPGLHRYEAYVCGPTGMTLAVVNSLVAAGIPRRRIHHESFDF